MILLLLPNCILLFLLHNYNNLFWTKNRVRNDNHRIQLRSVSYDDYSFIQELHLWKNKSLPLDATRLFHGRGNFYQNNSTTFTRNITLDWFPPVFLLTYHAKDPSQEPSVILQQYLNRWLFALSELIGGENQNEPVNLVFQSRPSSAFRNQTITKTLLVSGSIPEPHLVTENGAKYQVHLIKGQNHGLFLDMANGRSWLRKRCEEKHALSEQTKVLNLFSYSCAFSVAALLGGAKEVINIDMSQGSLTLGQKNHMWNNLMVQQQETRARFWCHDIFKSWGKISRHGPYDIIVVDPPTFQKGSFVANKDYGKIIQRIPSLMKTSSDSLAMLCLNAPELSCQFLKDLVIQEAPQLEFVQRLPNPESFPVLDPDRALKILIYRWRPTG